MNNKKLEIQQQSKGVDREYRLKVKATDNLATPVSASAVNKEERSVQADILKGDAR